MYAIEFWSVYPVFGRNLAPCEANSSHLGGLRPQQLLSLQKNIGECTQNKERVCVFIDTTISNFPETKYTFHYSESVLDLCPDT